MKNKEFFTFNYQAEENSKLRYEDVGTIKIEVANKNNEECFVYTAAQIQFAIKTLRSD